MAQCDLRDVWRREGKRDLDNSDALAQMGWVGSQRGVGCYPRRERRLGRACERAGAIGARDAGKECFGVGLCPMTPFNVCGLCFAVC